MALRTTLNDIVEMVRDEARLSSNTSRGTDHLPHIKRLIKRHYQTLAESYDWQHLELKREMSTKVMVANQRYYDFPENLNTDKIEEAWYKYGSVWVKLDYGINYNDLNAQDSDEGDTSDPVLKWDFYGDQQFEVYPVPASGGIISFIGQKKIEALDTNDSRADLDDIMISLFVAAEILAGNSQQAAAQIKAEAANTRLLQVKSGKGSKMRIKVGGGEISDSSPCRPRNIEYVR
jgi:hypothetical protein